MGRRRWILRGDLNIILYLEEKRRGIRRMERDNEELQNVIDDIDLIELETHNETFT